MKHEHSEYGGGGGGWGKFTITCECYRCKRNEEVSIVRSTWLEPYFVRQIDQSYLQSQLCPSCAKWNPLYWLKVVWKLRIGRISNLLAPGYSACGRCHTNWHFAEGHSTRVPDTDSGVFPLCEQCWSDLTPTQRLPYYRRLFESWGSHESFTWEQLERAVLSEPLR